MLFYFFYVLCLQLLSWCSTDVPVLLAELTWLREAIATAGATRATLVLAVETSARGAAAVWDIATLCVKDVEDRASLAQREALEWVSRLEAESATMFACAYEDAEGLSQKVTLLEGELAVEHQAWKMSERDHRAHFKELTLLQTRGSELCHAIIGPPRAKHHLSEGM
jgi:hypothetical protein